MYPGAYDEKNVELENAFEDAVIHAVQVETMVLMTLKITTRYLARNWIESYKISVHLALGIIGTYSLVYLSKYRATFLLKTLFRSLM